MIKHILLLSYRNIKSNILYSSIIIVALAITFVIDFIILVYWQQERSVDAKIVDSEHKYRICTNSNFISAFGTLGLVNLIKTEIPEAEKIVVFRGIRNSKILETNGNETAYKGLCVNNSFFDFFDIQLLTGNFTINDFISVNEIYVSEDFAKKKNLNVGMQIDIKIEEKKRIFNIKGIYKKFSDRISLSKADIIFNIDVSSENSGFENLENDLYKMPVYQLFIHINSVDYKNIESKINTNIQKHVPKDNFNPILFQPLADMYLHSENIKNNRLKTGNLKLINQLIQVGWILTIISLLNYIMLRVSLFVKRNKEMAIKKVLGATAHDVGQQLIIESLLYSIVAILLSITMLLLFYEPIKKLLELQNIDWLVDLPAFLIFFVIILFFSLLSSAYLFYFSNRLTSIEFFHGEYRFFKIKGITLQNVSVILQLTTFIFVMFCSIVMKKQLDYSYQKDLGFNSENLYILNLNDFALRTKINAIAENLTTFPFIINLSKCTEVPPTNNSTNCAYSDFLDPQKKIDVENLSGDNNFIKTLELKILDGDDFSSNKFSDSAKNCVFINKSVIDELHLSEPIGKKIGSYFIIGVVSNFHVHSIHDKIPPLIIDISTASKYFRRILIRTSKIDYLTLKKSINDIISKFKSNADSYELIELKEQVKELYAEEQNIYNILIIIIIILVLITGAALFGLSAFTTKKKLKEITIRKIHGATWFHNIFILSKPYFVSMFISLILAFNFAYYYIQEWLCNYAYHVQITLSIYLFTVLFAVILVAFAIFYNVLDTLKKSTIELLKCN